MSGNDHDHGHSQGFLRTYLFSLDHKMIGRQFLFLGVIMLILGGVMAMGVRYQLAFPEQGLPSWVKGIPEREWTVTYEDGEDANSNRTLDAGEDTNGNGKLDLGPAHINDKFYNSLFTMHATIMIFFAAMPILVGCFGNFLIPLMIGARDMAFPVLNMLSFWVTVVSGVLMLAAFGVAGGAAAGGWTGYPPLSAVPSFTGVEWGQHLWCISLIVSGIASLMGSINYITTVINMRAPGMHWFRMPLTVWSLFITAILLLLALPVLTSALAMLLFDRMAGTHFFTVAGGGGGPLLWQHLFWFFGHPEVYVLVLPAMGMVSDVLATFCRKPIFGYRAMAYAMIAIAFLGWIVWGHHMFVSGMSPYLGTSFMLSTMVIAVPSAIKTFNWLGTIWGGSIRFTVPLLFAVGFVVNFLIGGLSGIFMASTPFDIYIHDTYFIVAHFHYVVAGIIFAIFAGVYYWFPKMFARRTNSFLGYLHFAGTFIFFHATFFPMHILGVAGHPRRIYNPELYHYLDPIKGVNHWITISAFCLGAAQIPFFLNFFGSLFFGPKADRNPWQANSLEWSSPTPGIHGNFQSLPTVYRGPYEYSVPGMTEDFLPQDQAGGPATPDH